MIAEQLYIKKGEWLKKVLNQIPSNTILRKTICGIGATTLEIEAERNSIIIEPNVPVIKGKITKHPQMLGVYEGVGAEEIKNHITNKNNSEVTIITTPESYPKVKKAFRELNIDYRKLYFMLFDECEKIVQDIDYRTTIMLPIDDFFQFENKAMVSATPIIPPDPRFEKQNFKVLEIIPNYDHKIDLCLHPTNNVLCTLRKVMARLEEYKDVPICVFYNSTDGIDELISLLDIKELSNVFCGHESVEKLRDMGYKNVWAELYNENDEISLKRYNFFTSRFYSAVDIELKVKPIVIVLSDVIMASHSKIDPRTEAIQIVGRFRNGITKYIHITNYNKKVECKSRKSIEEFLNGQHTIYSELFQRKLTSRNNGERHLLQQALDSVDYKRYATSKGDKNYFMYHNTYIEEELKTIYRYPAPIKACYENTNAFNVFPESIYSRFTDKDRRELNSKARTQTELNRLAFYQILSIMKSKKKDEFDIEYLKDLKSTYTFIFEALRVVGPKRIVELKFKEPAIRREVEMVNRNQSYLNPKVVKAIQRRFKENQWYSSREIDDTICEVFIVNGIKPDGRGNAPKINLYFHASKRRKNYSDGWDIGKRKIFKE
ncbi:MAG: hypothetical protein LUE26_07040 [Alistipes sp.]|nr:hypothetical protein [Alistipes sp.]